MRMARVNVYLPDELAVQARDANLNVSGLTQEAVRAALVARRTDVWLESLHPGRPQVDLDSVLRAVRSARDDLEQGRE